MRVCQKCGHERTAHDEEFVPAGECPKCGVVYAKYHVAVHAEPAMSKAIPRKSPSAGAAKITVFVVLVLACVYAWQNRLSTPHPDVLASTSGFVDIPPVAGAEANRVLILGPT